MFSVRGLRVSVRFRHSLRDCSGVVSETGASDGDNSGQLTRRADQDTQILSLPSELARLVTETKVDSVTNRIPVSKEKMRSRSGDSVVMVCSQISSKSSVAFAVYVFHNPIPVFSPDLSQLFGTGFNLTSPDMWRRQFS